MKHKREIVKCDHLLSSRLYNLLRGEKYGYVFNAYLTDECPECSASKEHLGHSLSFLLCHKCKQVTAVVLS